MVGAGVLQRVGHGVGLILGQRPVVDEPAEDVIHPATVAPVVPCRGAQRTDREDAGAERRGTSSEDGRRDDGAMAPTRSGPIAALEEFALSLPGAFADMPWEDDFVAKVGKKIFVFFGPTTISVKLPESGDQARSLPGAEPTSYGLGRHGWVTVPIAGTAAPAMGVLEDWVEESYRTVAPKKQVAELDARSA